MAEKTKDRVYVVDIVGQRPRLVRATFAHIAERHVIGQLVSARVATKDDLVDLMTRGVRCENAGDAATQQLSLGGSAGPTGGVGAGGTWEQRSEELSGFENTGA